MVSMGEYLVAATKKLYTCSILEVSKLLSDIIDPISLFIDPCTATI